MNTTYLMYADAARVQIDDRLREADNERRRRLARHRSSSSPRTRVRHLW
jgi:hypothetical protein